MSLNGDIEIWFLRFSGPPIFRRSLYILVIDNEFCSLIQSDYCTESCSGSVEWVSDFLVLGKRKSVIVRILIFSLHSVNLFDASQLNRVGRGCSESNIIRTIFSGEFDENSQIIQSFTRQ